jgi:hypothetical protein
MAILRAEADGRGLPSSVTMRTDHSFRAATVRNILDFRIISRCRRV